MNIKSLVCDKTDFTLHSEFYNPYKVNNNLAKMELKASEILLGEV